jgi:hypothetical protein
MSSRPPAVHEVPWPAPQPPIAKLSVVHTTAVVDGFVSIKTLAAPCDRMRSLDRRTHQAP